MESLIYNKHVFQKLTGDKVEDGLKRRDGGAGRYENTIAIIRILLQ